MARDNRYRLKQNLEEGAITVGTRRTRLGIFCPGKGTGGPWRYVHSLLSGIDLAEFDVTVFSHLSAYEPRPGVRAVCLSATSGATAKGAHPPSTTAKPVAWKSRLRPLVPSFLKLWSGFARETRSLADLLRRHQLDLLHTNNTGCEESPVAARWAEIPYVVGTFHVDSTYDLHKQRSGPRHRALEILSNRCLDQAIAVSRATKADWVRRSYVPAESVTTVYNGIDTDKCQRRLGRATARQCLGLPTDDRLIVGGLGRLDEAKGYSYLIDAAARLLPLHPDLLVVIAGDGPLRPALVEQARQRGISDRVRFLGFQSDVQLVLDALDVFALPSLCEALPYALLEAMATELPCVGTRVGGVPEMIVPGETGLLVQPRRAEELAEALLSLLSSPDLRSRMGRAGRQRVVRHFQEREMVRRTIEVYRKKWTVPQPFSGA